MGAPRARRIEFDAKAGFEAQLAALDLKDPVAEHLESTGLALASWEMRRL